jgi:hypothetical protein
MLSDKQRKDLKALISMMDEPDEQIFETLKHQVLKYKIEAFPMLEDAWMAAHDLLVTHRLESLMDEVNFLYVFDEMEKWLQMPDHDLLKPMTLLDRLCYMDSFRDDSVKDVEALVRDTWLEINENLTALEKINVLNHVFYKLHGFYAPETLDEAMPSFFLSYLLKEKKGNPTSMAMLYLMVAQYLQLPVYGVNLPGHLIVAYVNDRYFLKKEKDYTASDVMFYVNPYNSGTVFTVSEIDLYIKQLKIPFKEKYYLPSENKAIVKRYLKELEKGYAIKEDQVKKEQLNKLLTLF